ncbi:MAG TPA: 2-oxoacid:acceptor oxidoreductase family protein [Thermodesulfobacteriota bacterium]|nr:2-oxoacid:acceptor oxidoreductase family protein [Thermodesulfobacteriota bacterium]
MIEIKISGRGGQGVVLASQILAAALSRNGMWVQAFPSFGAERRGAPVSAFVRADREEITLRCGVYHPDWIIVLDAQLLGNAAILSGIKEDGSILVNGKEVPEEVHRTGRSRVFVVDAVAIAQSFRLGTDSFPIVNTAMAGAFAKASGLISLDRILEAVREAVPVEKERNEAAAREAYEHVKRIIPPPS